MEKKNHKTGQRRGPSIGLAAVAFVLGLALVAPAQVGLWVSTVTGVTTSGTVAITNNGSSALSVTGGIAGNTNSSFTSSAATTNTFDIRSTDSGTNTTAAFRVGNDLAANAAVLVVPSSGFTGAGAFTADTPVLASNRPGGLNIGAHDASGEVRIYTGGQALRFIIDSAGRLLSGAAQPGFLVYNSADDDGVGSGSMVDFDSEVYDNANNFANDVFTAPVPGHYLLCATVGFKPVTEGFITIVTSNRSYRISSIVTSGDSGSSGCVIADFDAGSTANIVVTSTGGNVDIHGSGSPYVTFFSGRLVP